MEDYPGFCRQEVPFLARHGNFADLQSATGGHPEYPKHSAVRCVGMLTISKNYMEDF